MIFLVLKFTSNCNKHLQYEMILRIERKRKHLRVKVRLFLSKGWYSDMSGLSAIARQIFISLEIRTLWKADCLVFLCFDEAEYYCYYGHHLTWYLIVYYSNSMHKSNTSLYSKCVVVSASLSHVFYPLHHSYILVYFLCCIIFHLCLCCIYTFFS